MGSTLGAALTERRPLGPAEAWTLLYGALLLGAIGVLGINWPRGLAWPLGGLALWLAASWLLRASRLWGGRRQARQTGRVPPEMSPKKGRDRI